MNDKLSIFIIILGLITACGVMMYIQNMERVVVIDIQNISNDKTQYTFNNVVMNKNNKELQLGNIVFSKVINNSERVYTLGEMTAFSKQELK
jgi:hypothetical protein